LTGLRETLIVTEHDTAHARTLGDVPLTWRNAPRLLPLALIRLYQETISRALPAGTCRFHPSCSQYSFEAISKYGLLKGGWMSFWRILRCQPFHPGGYDPVP
jgi:putative membrane protein insertion efficiency factor